MLLKVFIQKYIFSKIEANPIPVQLMAFEHYKLVTEALKAFKEFYGDKNRKKKHINR